MDIFLNLKKNQKLFGKFIDDAERYSNDKKPGRRKNKLNNHETHINRGLNYYYVIGGRFQNDQNFSDKVW